MPLDNEKLSDAEMDILVRWIESGAVWPGQMKAVTDERSDHRSFQPVTSSAEPSSGPPVDRRVPAPQTQRERPLVLGACRAAIADPPGVDRVDRFDSHTCRSGSFLKSHAADADRAYHDLVDRLMASPHFGERWAQHWLDVIRWAETNGSESNLYRKRAWVYRDYVVRAFNEDKPYDRFLLEQIAGDTVGQGDATGYLFAGPHVPAATVGREPVARRQARADRVDEVLRTIGASALGVSIGCARCHNHKFDPISIRDYYSMAAVFAGVEFGSRVPEADGDSSVESTGDVREEIDRLRRKLTALGPWEEDWVSHKEVRFPTVSTRALRIAFDRRYVRLDELEAINESTGLNVASSSAGAEAECPDGVTKPMSPLHRINDGTYGDDAWEARTTEDSDAEIAVTIRFAEPAAIDLVRLSSNREDYVQTDYLEGINRHEFEPFTIEALTDDGEWVSVASTRELEELSQTAHGREAALDELGSLVARATSEGPQPSFVGRFIQPATTYLLVRGSPENPRGEVFAAGLSEIGGDLGVSAEAPGPERRRAFAEWVTDPTNPLTARVIVNRLWRHVFGRGIVATPSDFGAAGAPPTHPELLDWARLRACAAYGRYRLRRIEAVVHETHDPPDGDVRRVSPSE